MDGKRPAVEWVTSLPREWRVTESERLVLLCLACDAYADESAPGYDLIAEWTGMRRSSCAEILARLCAHTPARPALLERISVRGRRRTIWRLLTGEPSGHAGQINRPATPDGSTLHPDPEPSGATGRLEAGELPENRPATPDASGENRPRTVGEPSANRPATSDAPFALSPKPQTQEPSHAPADADDVEVEDAMPQTETLDLGAEFEPPPRGPSPVQILVAAYVDRVRGRASTSLRGAIGRSVKRLIEADGFEPALILAAIEEAAPHGRRDLDRIIAAPGLTRRFESHEGRRAMFEHWARIANEIDARSAV